MNRLKTILLILPAFVIGFSACSSTVETKEADLDKAQHEPMRDRNQNTSNNTAGHQNDQVRDEHR